MPPVLSPHADHNTKSSAYTTRYVYHETIRQSSPHPIPPSRPMPLPSPTFICSCALLSRSISFKNRADYCAVLSAANRRKVATRSPPMRSPREEVHRFRRKLHRPSLMEMTAQIRNPLPGLPSKSDSSRLLPSFLGCWLTLSERTIATTMLFSSV